MASQGGPGRALGANGCEARGGGGCRANGYRSTGSAASDVPPRDWLRYSTRWAPLLHQNGSEARRTVVSLSEWDGNTRP